MVIAMVRVESSNIEAVGYDAGTRVLVVIFKSRAVYDYAEVEPAVYEQLLASESKGRFLNERIKGHYSYKRRD